jgi:hypothetical protein
MNKDIIEIHLTEYRALREEQKTRFTMNSTILNVIVLVVDGELAAYVQMIINNKEYYIFTILLLSPIITTPLVLMYYDNQFMVYRIGRYFTEELYDCVKSLSIQNIFGWETFHQRSSSQLFLVAFGRNIFFVLITLVPLVIFHFFRGEGHLARWQWFVMAIDIIFVMAVLVTWVQSGIMFWGIGKSYKIPQVKEKA